MATAKKACAEGFNQDRANSKVREQKNTQGEPKTKKTTSQPNA
jgi:hypothetical protein